MVLWGTSVLLIPTTSEILAARPKRNSVRLDRPDQFLVEPECSAAGNVVDVATLFLTNRECPFRCLMCDLWKNTTVKTPESGRIPEQIQYALQRLPASAQIKLYNSGNFFDAAAFPAGDRHEVARLVAGFETVIVENHPRLCGPDVVAFRDQIRGRLEVAMGLETSHLETLSRLNKQMTTDQFAVACEFLLQHDIDVRAFVLLKPPWTTEQQGIDRAIESVRFAFDCGVQCCAVIPTRAGNGMMDRLEELGQFASPELESLEHVMNVTLSWQRGRVFADLWDLQRFAGCDDCFRQREERLHQMNLQQQVLPAVRCDRCNTSKEV